MKTFESSPNSSAAWNWLQRRPALLLTLLVVLSLLPFINKPFHIDDPLFIWAAQHIQEQPGNPYNFFVNWSDKSEPMWEVTKNPPLACYYLAFCGSLLGWSEPALHLAFMLPAVAAVLGVFWLAREFCSHPLLAALLAFFTPVFLVSSTTIMCDVLMLAFWVWAVVLWMNGARSGNHPRLALAAILVSLAALTKYFGAAALPLLAVWTCIGKHRWKRTLGWLLIPLAVLAAYQIVTQELYGRGLLSDAGAFASTLREAGDPRRLQTVLIGLSFTGGCLGALIFFAPLLWTRRILIISAAAWVTLGLTLHHWQLPSTITVQFALWLICGVGVLWLAAADLLKNRNAESWLLALWTGGTFVFATFLNWTINARTILPMCVPLALLIVRRLEVTRVNTARIGDTTIALPLAAAAVMSLLVARADFVVAKEIRNATREIAAKYGRNGRLWFQGHWGFQYYMEESGAKPLDTSRLEIQPGDYLAVPANNTPLTNPFKNPAVVTPVESIPVPGPDWLTTMHPQLGANFYAAVWGPLPFAFGAVPPNEVIVVRFAPESPLVKAMQNSWHSPSRSPN